MKKYGKLTVLLLTMIIVLTGCGNSGANQTKEKLISENEAKKIALEHAGISEGDTTFVKSKLEMEDGVQEYEIEFYTKDTEYDYKIDATNGEIRSYDNELENRAASAPKEGQASITLEEAGALALKKVPGAADANMRIKEELEDGRPVYEGTILYENKEYDFQIDAATGEFIEWEID